MAGYVHKQCSLCFKKFSHHIGVGSFRILGGRDLEYCGVRVGGGGVKGTLLMFQTFSHHIGIGSFRILGGQG